MGLFSTGNPGGRRRTAECVQRVRQTTRAAREQVVGHREDMIGLVVRPVQFE